MERICSTNEDYVKYIKKFERKNCVEDIISEMKKGTLKDGLTL
jgi:hypothetical protein